MAVRPSKLLQWSSFGERRYFTMLWSTHEALFNVGFFFCEWTLVQYTPLTSTNLREFGYSKPLLSDTHWEYFKIPFQSHCSTGQREMGNTARTDIYRTRVNLSHCTCWKISCSKEHVQPAWETFVKKMRKKEKVLIRE